MHQKSLPEKYAIYFSPYSTATACAHLKIYLIIVDTSGNDQSVGQY